MKVQLRVVPNEGKKVLILSLLQVKMVLNLITSSLMVPALSLKTVMLYPWAHV